LLPKICPVCESRYPADFKVCPRDAARLDDAEGDDDELIGTVLGDALRITRAIGEGGTARVYEARHVRLESKRFAVKVLHAFYATQPTALARFQREAEAASAIGHPGIVQVFDVHRTPDGRAYLVTELLEGQDFGSLLKKTSKVDAKAAVRIVRAACRALAAAHAQGIVHRDMKPENLFLTGPVESASVKLLDFGISKVESAGAAQLTRTGMVVGTPAYMSPEQAAGSNVDARTDVYALGAILYRALTGRTPFQGSDGAEVLSAVLTSDPPRPRSLAPEIADGLELVIERAMAKSPEDRYPTVEELDAALAAFDDAPLARAGDAQALAGQVTPSAPDDAARNARRARPRVVLGSLAAYLWGVACVSDALVSVLSLSDAGRAEGGGGRLVGVAVGTLAVSSGPLVLWVRHVARQWKNTMRTLELSRLLSRVTLTAILSYAVGALMLRLASAVTQIGVLNPAGSPAGVALAIVSLAAGAAAYGASRSR
jgi:hypothetical protein